MVTPKKILVPIDFSDYSDNALIYACELAKQFRAKIYVLHVVESKLVQCIDDYCLSDELIRHMGGEQGAMSGSDYSLSQQMVERIQQEMNQSSKDQMVKILEKVPEAQGLEIVTEAWSGVPYEAIVNYQKEKGIDLIVMPTHGKGGVARFYLGSTAEKVVRKSPCPVLTVRMAGKEFKMP